MSLVGYFDGSTESPLLLGRLLIRRLGVDRELRFLVDTGAAYTMLSSDDTGSLRIDVRRFSPGPLIAGVGGQVRPFSEPATLIFQETPRRIHVYRVNIIIASARTIPRGLPSVLGRDILNRWHMSYRPTERRLEFEVVSADDTVDLDV